MLYVKKRQHFPDPALPTMDGIVAIGDSLNISTLLEAYSFGIFPWPHDELPCLWFCPEDRGILDFSDLRVNRSFSKFLKKSEYRITFNKAFAEVIQECAKVPRVGQTGTWISSPIIKAYIEFHKAGYAHSVECWAKQELVGGLYGVFVGGSFSGESMFYKQSNASKLCLYELIAVLKKNGLTWMDIQMVTPATKSLGGRYITKHEFLKRLKQSQRSAKTLRFD